MMTKSIRPKNWEDLDRMLEPYFNKPQKITRKMLIYIYACMMIWKQLTK
jgi:hypothetical protein